MSALLQATHLDVEADPRYWEDACVDGTSDDDGTLIPGREGDSWKVRIDLATGRIEDWPAGVAADIRYKVCDAGEYWLSQADGRRMAKWRGSYVPHEFLSRDGSGSDYIVLKVDGQGLIAGFRHPGIDEQDWIALGAHAGQG